MFSLLYPPRWPIRGTRYEYSPNDDFLRGSRDVFATMSTWVAYSVHQVQIQLRRQLFPRKSRCFRYFDTTGGLFGAPGMNTAPTTTFSEEVEMFSLLWPPRWPIRCTRYKYNFDDIFPQGSRDFLATLTPRVAYSLHQIRSKPSHRRVAEVEVTQFLQKQLVWNHVKRF
ncbi:unnamed protein product [Trichogramma brassicae]|uniref:Uncharacterized protein n=1 Tax=Trichogramma brassicae TaxID=86971 RepID=A0A6H5HT59_9HYME|nr:unnamed protein product [Trichogramma brassicae]